MVKDDKRNGSRRQPTIWAAPATQILRLVGGDATALLPAGSSATDEARVPLERFYDLLERAFPPDGDTLRALTVAAVRKARATACLDADMAIDEVAYLIGYRDRSTFHRAFKRWTGVTPDAWKQGR